MEETAQIIISVIPIVGIGMGAVVVFFYLLWNHRQKTLLIQTGQYKKPVFDFYSFSLFSGLLLSTVGTALTILLSILEGASYGLLGGIIPLSLGVGMLAYFFIKRREKLNG